VSVNGAAKPMAYEEALARIMLVMDGPNVYSGSTGDRLEIRARVQGPITGKLRALRSRGWVTYKPSSWYGGGYWRLTAEGARVQTMLRIVRDRTVESPAWP
jgi:hypothetical protein